MQKISLNTQSRSYFYITVFSFLSMKLLLFLTPCHYSSFWLPIFKYNVSLTAVTFSWCTKKMCNSISKLTDNVTNYLQNAFKQFIFVDSFQKLLCKVINWKNFWFLLFCLSYDIQGRCDEGISGLQPRKLVNKSV
jgi:hypothetical protein